jgi:hypothetical protein
VSTIQGRVAQLEASGQGPGHEGQGCTSLQLREFSRRLDAGDPEAERLVTLAARGRPLPALDDALLDARFAIAPLHALPSTGGALGVWIRRC